MVWQELNLDFGRELSLSANPLWQRARLNFKAAGCGRKGARMLPGLSSRGGGKRHVEQLRVSRIGVRIRDYQTLAGDHPRAQAATTAAP